MSCHVLDSGSHRLFLSVRVTLASFSLLLLFLCQKIPLPSLLVNSFFLSVLLLLLYFDIILDLNINCKMSTKNSQILFTQNPQMLTFYHICVIILLLSSFPLPQHNFFLNHLRISFRLIVFYWNYFQIIQSKKTRTLLHRDCQMAHW